MTSSAGELVHDPIERLYVDHHGWLLGWLRRRLGDAFLAADLSHDTFVRVLAKDELPAIREPGALLTTIANGLVLNWRRHQRIEQAFLETLALLPEPLALSPEAKAILLERLTGIDRALDDLPSRVRQAFLMSQLDGLRQEEIAQRLGLSVPTVRRYVVRALAQCCFADA